jgi:2-amino-4-hydroxy-6-hydroxymethyldihydropteridine diphosphokinase
MYRAYLGMGSNLGNREHYLHRATLMIEGNAGMVVQVSPLYETEPLGFNSSRMFLNCCVEIMTGCSPEELIKKLFVIESAVGRKRAGNGITDRCIDIDILLFDDVVMSIAELKIPHPEMHRRRFVLQPLSDIAGGVVHPVLHERINVLLNNCDDQGMVRAYQPRLNEKFYGKL